MIFKTIKYEKYAERAYRKLSSAQKSLRKNYDTDNYANWFYTQSMETLRLYSGQKEIFFKYIQIGTFSHESKTWLWAWANENSIEPNRFDMLKVKKIGQTKKYENLINSQFEGNKQTGWELSAIAFNIIGGIGVYRAVSDHLEIYLLLSKELSKNEVERMESKLIECEAHGKLRQAFVCQHLNRNAKTGFVEAFETSPGMKLHEEDDLQAWCLECEKRRFEANGWTDNLMKFSNINLVCERCYFEIKDLHKSLN